MAALQRYLKIEIDRRAWSVEEFSRRAGFSTTRGYQILGGKDNVQFNTFEAIATALGMTPADLATAIGKGSTETNADELNLVAHFRQVPAEQQSAAWEAATGLFSVFAKTRPSPVAKTSTRSRNTSSKQPAGGSDNSLTARYHLPHGVLATAVSFP